MTVMIYSHKLQSQENNMRQSPMKVIIQECDRDVYFFKENAKRYYHKSVIFRNELK